MGRYLALFLLSNPLLVSAVENADFEPATLQKRISTVLSGKSDRSDRLYWRSLLKWSDDCESAFQDPQNSGIEIYAAQSRQYVVSVTCTLGAYQGYQQFYNVSLDNDKVTINALMFPTFDVENKKKVTKTLTSEVWGNVLRTSDYKNMTVLNRYSGYGHCGTMTTYKIINGKVTVTKLLAQPDCESSKASRDPEKWPEYPIP